MKRSTLWQDPDSIDKNFGTGKSLGGMRVEVLFLQHDCRWEKSFSAEVLHLCAVSFMAVNWWICGMNVAGSFLILFSLFQRQSCLCRYGMVKYISFAVQICSY